MAFLLRGKTRCARPARLSRRRSHRPALEVLEGRVVPSFAAPVSYTAGTQTTQGLNGFGPQVITGDFWNDGKLDLAVTNTADGTVSILRGHGDGTFQPAVNYATGLGAGNPVWLAAADFNSDGKFDLAVEGNNGEVSIMLGNGDGTFAPPKTYAAGSGDRGGLAVGDYFGNGRQDIAVADFGSNTVEILPNNGDGSFGTPIVLAMPSGFSNIRSIATGNFFGNGYADLAVAGGEGYNNVLSSTNPAGVALFENDGQGHFTYEGKYLAAVTPDPSGGNGQGDTVNPEHVNVADLNNDGKPDLVLSLYDHNIDVFLNNGNGTFQPAVAYTTETAGSVGGYPRGVVFGDFNGDGKVDIATLNFGEPVPADQSSPQPGSVGVLYGNGDGTFQAPIQYTPYTLPGGLAVGDFNGDGLADLAVTQNYTGHSVAVMLNQPNTAQEPPTVTGASPATGPTGGGTVVTITGTNFTGTTQVNFGSARATSFTVNSDTSITATAPPVAAGAVDITVYNAGASATSPADQFTFFVPVTTDTWTGLGTTNNWSDAANWSSGTVPGAGTTVIFDGTSGKDAVVDPGFAGTVTALQIKSGYTGTVSLDASMTVTGAFTEQAGTFDANGQATNVGGLTTVSGGTYLASTNAQTFTGGLTVSGGTFTGSTGPVTAGNVTLSSGTLNAPSGILTVAGGNFTYTAGTFNADLGTVTYTGSNVSPTVSVGTGSVRFYNFQDQITDAFPAGMTISGTLTVTGTLTWKTGSGALSGNIEAQGNVDDQNHGGTGNPYFTLDGTANQTIEDTSGGGGGFLRTMTINKPGGTVSLACNPLVFSSFTLTAGTVNTGANTWLLGGQGPVSAASDLNLGNIEIEGSSVTVGSTSLQVANVSFAAASDKLTAPTGNLLVSGNWNNSLGASFTPNGGTVVFDGGGGIQQLTSGGRAFNNLTILAGSTVQLEDNLAVTGVLTNLGTLILPGAPTVAGVSPATGPTGGGTVVTLTGTNFTGASAVKFGSVSATSFTVNSATSIIATAPPEAAGIVDITVTNSVATSAAGAADQYTYQAPYVATITVSPATASVAAGSTQSFTATALDQFGQALATQPTFTWSVAPGGAGGTINTSGLYTAPAAGIGSDTVLAASGSVSGSASVTVTGSSSASASFVGTDTTTGGDWRSAYGGDGYDIAQDTSGTNPSLPSYAQVSLSGQSNWTWPSGTAGLVPLQNAAGNGTILACWYAPNSMDIGIDLTDGQTHQVALYATNPGSMQRFDVVSAATGAVLTSETLSGTAGQYIVWELKGDVIIQVTNLGPDVNANINAIFFGGP